jgi:hypothetical protein
MILLKYQNKKTCRSGKVALLQEMMMGEREDKIETHNRNRSLIGILLATALLLSGIYFMTCVSTAIADDYAHKGKQFGWNLFSTSKHGKSDKGNEFTGEVTAWIFAVANLPVLLSLLVRAIYNAAMARNLKDRLKRFNQAQKKYFMPFHYFLNPLALLIAFIHFSLSHCRSSSLPEWGVAVMASLVLTGMLVKFKVSPRSIRRSVYKIHTNPLSIGLLVIILMVGHSIVD